MSLFRKLKDWLNSGKFGYLAKNSLLLTIGSFGSKLLGFLLFPLYTNVLSTAEYGTADLVTTTSYFLLYLVTLNIGDAVFVFTMQDAGQDGCKYLKYGMTLIARNCLLSSGVLLLLRVFRVIPWPDYCYLFLFLHLTLISAGEVIRGYLQATDKVKIIAVSGVITTFVTVAGNLLLLLVFHLGIIGYFVSMLAGLAVSLIYCLANCEGIREGFQRQLCDVETRKAMLRFSIPLVFNGVAWWVNSSLDRYLVTAISGVEMNGIYSVAAKIPSILGMLNSIFAQAWTISAVKEYDRNDEDGFFNCTYTSYVAAMAVCCSGLILFNIPLAKVLFAKDFFVAWQCSSWLLVSAFFSAMGSFLASIFSAVKDSRIVAVSTVVSALINTTLNLLLIPRYQAVGASVATVVSFFSIWMIRYFCSKKYILWKNILWKDLLVCLLLVLQVLQEGFLKNHGYVGQSCCFLCILFLYGKVLLKQFKGNLFKKQT